MTNRAMKRRGRHSLRQRTGAQVPSVRRRMPSTVYCSGERVRR